MGSNHRASGFRRRLFCALIRSKQTEYDIGLWGFVFSHPDRVAKAERGRSFAVSLVIHCAVLALIWWFPSFSGSDIKVIVRERPILASDGHKRPVKITWYRRPPQLPTIAPAKASLATGRVQDKRHRVYIHVDPTNAPHKDQFIYSSDPKVIEERPLSSSNVVMTDLVSPTSPPNRREPRKFAAMPPRRSPGPEAAKLQEPRIAANVDPPGVPQVLVPESIKNAARPPLKRFYAPVASGVRPVKAVVLPEPEGLPTVDSSVRNPKLTLDTGLLGAHAPPAKKLIPPPSLAGSGGRRSAAAADLEDPGIPTASGHAGVPSDVAAVILSANPTPDGRLIRPDGNRQAQVELGPRPNGPGGGNGGAGPADLVFPGLTVRGDAEGRADRTTAARNRTPEPAERDEMTPSRPPAYRPRLDSPSVSIPQWPSTRHVPKAVEELFTGRPVYSAAIAGPAGYPDWVLWFGEVPPNVHRTRSLMRPPRLDAGAGLLASLRLPGARRFWVKAKLNKGGKLVSLDIAHGPAGGASLELAGALEKCQWTPAIRNGEAVEVDVMIEVNLANAK